MVRRLLSSLIDEAFGLMLLHQVLRFGDRPAVTGFANDPVLRSGDPQTFFGPVPEPADLRSQRREIGRTAHAIVEDFDFASPVQTPFRRNNVVRGRMWRVPRAQRALVLIDGIVQFGYGSERLFADRLNPAGLDVVTIDLPFNHHRTPSGYRPGQLIVGGDLDHTLGVLRQAVLDTSAVIRGLQAEGREVALAGISFGGWTALSTALVAPELASVTAIAPPVDMLRVLTEGGVIVRAARRGLDLSPARRTELRSIARAVTPSAWLSPLPPGRVMLHAADYDRFVPTSRIAALAERWAARLVRYPAGHIQLTCFPRWLAKIADTVRDSAWQSGSTNAVSGNRPPAEIPSAREGGPVEPS